MYFQKRWGFGFGTLFSLIVVYFIYLYSREKEWALLALVSRWYIIIVVGLIAFSFGIILLIILFSLLIFMISAFKLHSYGKKREKHKNKQYIDAEYKIRK